MQRSKGCTGLCRAAVALTLAILISGKAQALPDSYDDDSKFDDSEWHGSGEFFERKKPPDLTIFALPPKDETAVSRFGNENVVFWKIHIGGRANESLGDVVLAAMRAMENYNDKMVVDGEPLRAVKYKILRPSNAVPEKYNKLVTVKGRQQQNNTKGKVLTIYPPNAEDIPVLFANLRHALSSVPNIADHYNTTKDPTIALGERVLGLNKDLPLTISFGVCAGHNLVEVPANFRNHRDVAGHLISITGSKSNNSADNKYVNDNDFRRENPNGGIPPWKEAAYAELARQVDAMDRKLAELDEKKRAEKATLGEKATPKERRSVLGRFFSFGKRDRKRDVEISEPLERPASNASIADAARGQRAVGLSSGTSVSASAGSGIVPGRGIVAPGSVAEEIMNTLVQIISSDGNLRVFPTTLTAALMEQLPGTEQDHDRAVEAAVAVAQAHIEGRPPTQGATDTLERIGTRQTGPNETRLDLLERSYTVFTNPDGTISAFAGRETEGLLGDLNLPRPELRSLLENAVKTLRLNDAKRVRRDVNAQATLDQARNFLRERDRTLDRDGPSSAESSTAKGASSSSRVRADRR